jgi:hypothetical protein
MNTASPISGTSVVPLCAIDSTYYLLQEIMMSTTSVKTFLTVLIKLTSHIHIQILSTFTERNNALTQNTVRSSMAY